MLSGSRNPPPSTTEELLGTDLSRRLDRLDVISRKVFAGKLPGERRSKRRGQSVEFDDYRQYAPGDDLRHLDWNVFARLDRFFIKLFREEEDLALHVVIDASESMDAGERDASGGHAAVPSKLVFAHQIAMALGYVGLVGQNRVGVSVFGRPGEGLRRVSGLRGRRAVERLSAFLLESLRPVPHDAEADPPLDFASGLRRVALDRGGKGVLVLLSDLLVRDGLNRGLTDIGIAASKGSLDAFCLQLLSPGELDPASERDRGLVGDLRLTDAESGAPAEVTLSKDLLERYERRLRLHVDDVATLCASRSIDHLVVSTDTPVDRLVLQNLRRRGVVG
ncbi:MAG: DUF58 domain-containing protein [Planctomycetota bacterium]